MDKTKNEKFAQFITTSGKANGGDHTRYKFENGRGASVINGGIYARGLELAVLDSFDELDYSTPITDDVIGYLDDAGLESTLEAISKLPSE